MSAVLNRITIYPIKSLDGVDVAEAQVLAAGALENDRRFALVDADGRYVNGKRTAAIHRIRTQYNLEQMTVRFNHDLEFSLLHDRRKIGEWMSAALGIDCTVMENTAGGFPDDNNSPGPTLLSTATLAEVATWFPNMDVDEARRRFRANLELAGVEPFWEDNLVGTVGIEQPFQMGTVHWLGMNVCQRCVVPTRDSATGEPTRSFQKMFAATRASQLPAWAPKDKFDHFYRLSVNTRPAADQQPARMRVGESVSIS